MSTSVNASGIVCSGRVTIHTKNAAAVDVSNCEIASSGSLHIAANGGSVSANNCSIGEGSCITVFAGGEGTEWEEMNKKFEERRAAKHAQFEERRAARRKQQKEEE